MYISFIYRSNFRGESAAEITEC